MRIEIERVYEAARARMGLRVLVDRLWPRGLRKEDVRYDLWLKDLAPSDALRRWFAHEPARWDGFKARYFKELSGKAALIDELLAQARGRDIVLLYGAKDEKRNQAAALREFIRARLA